MQTKDYRMKLLKASKPFFSFSALAKPVFVAALAFGSGLALADEAADVSRMIRAGQLDQAMAKADVFLASKPRDAQMRFLKGLILTEKNKTADAIVVFTKLTEEYPELPEPYNNLAVLYASQGQYDKARQALEMAIRTHPSYATAHENLGDVYSKMASQSYDKALQLDGGNSTAQTKLALIRDMIGGKKGVPAPAAVASAPAPAAPQQAPAPAVIALSTPAAAKPQTAAPAVPAPAPTIAPAAAAAPVAKPTPAPIQEAAKPKQADRAQDDELAKTVQDWAKAWSDQNVSTYLGFYGKEFDTPKGQSRRKWENERRARIEGKNRIDVKVENIAVSYEGNKALVKFKQTYSSDKLSNVSTKTMVLAKNGSKWQIVEERSGG